VNWKAEKANTGEGYDAYVGRALASAPLSDATKRAIEALRLPALLVETTETAPDQAGASRFGGEPDLPAGTAWPRADDKPMSFVAQLRLADLAAISSATPLPKTGLLSFFVDEVTDSSFERGAVIWSNQGEIQRTPLPDDFARYVDGDLQRVAYGARGMAFTLAHKLPSSSNPAAADIPWTPEEKRTYSAIFQESLSTRSQVLGYRDRSYDAEQEATTALLLQCTSEGDMSWGDVDELFFYIPRAALEAADFGAAFPHVGE
jgi:hypothetical protein